MDTTTDSTRHPVGRAADNPSLRPLLTFVAVALPSGWILLGVPVALDLALEPFVLATLVVGLVVPAVVLTRRDPHASAAALWRDTVRLPRRRYLLLPAAFVLPGVTWLVAAIMGNAKTLDGDLLLGASVNVVSSVVIVNLWEEMAWQGFFQRRASARSGFVRGALVTTTMFVGVHLPLAFAEADDAAGAGRGLAALVVSGVGLRLLLGAVDHWSGRSLLTVAVVHASFNVAADFVDPTSDWVRYAVTLVLGLAVLATGMARTGARAR